MLGADRRKTNRSSGNPGYSSSPAGFYKSVWLENPESHAPTHALSYSDLWIYPLLRRHSRPKASSYDSPPLLCALYHIFHESSQICGKNTPTHFHVSHPVKFNARKSQDPQPHQISSSTVSLLRLYATPREHAIDVVVKLGHVAQ